MDLRLANENEPNSHVFSNFTESDKLLMCEVMRRRINRLMSEEITDTVKRDVQHASTFIDSVQQGNTNATTLGWAFISEIMELNASYVDDLAEISKQLGSIAYGAISERVQIQEAGMAAVELFIHSEMENQTIMPPPNTTSS